MLFATSTDVTKMLLVMTSLMLLVTQTQSAASIIFKDTPAESHVVISKQPHQQLNTFPGLLKIGNTLTRSHLRYCSCMPHQFCQPPPDGAGQIDIRIVTDPPSGVTCGLGLVYCCHNDTDPITPVLGCGVGQKIPINGGVSLVHGQSSFGEYPWTALVLGVGNDYVGGGALLDNYHVLTAAHRVAAYTNGVGLKVRLGEWNAGNDTEPFHFQEYSISSLMIHPHFDASNLHNDIALIKLSSAVPLANSPHVNPICLPESNTNFTGYRCWVSGWGKDAFGPSGNYQEIQKAVDVTVLDHDTCQTQLRSTRLGKYFQLDRKSFMCAGGESSKDACTGDGGSPLVCEVNGAFQLVGLVAWGIGCADYGVPGVYVNVPAYQHWIARHIGYLN